MTGTFQFDANQDFQRDAIASVADLFDGQPADAARLVTNLRGTIRMDEDSAAEFPGMAKDAIAKAERALEIGAIGNNLVLGRDAILANLQKVQDRNGLEVSAQLYNDALDFDVEMETGTGKTYVYLRTIFELAVKYRFTKFVILVPSVAIREGVNTSIRLMRSHFENLYVHQGVTFDSSVYSGKTPEDVQSFATATNVQIMVMTIGSMRERIGARAESVGTDSSPDEEARLILNRRRDKLNGLRPIDYLRATRPIVIMDEPQNMKSDLSSDALRRLDPAFVLRYSATLDKRRNLVYQLDPVDAHDKGLVKQIVVADVAQQGADATPYIRLVEVRRDPTWSARLELSCRKADGNVERRVVSVRPDQELSDERITGNPIYDGWRVMSGMNIAFGDAPGSIELNKYGILSEGETIGASTGAIYKEMIRETVREHLRKEAMLRPRGIKVLSLFFVDKVASFLGTGHNNDTANGDFARWFDEVLVEERARSARYGELLPQAPSELRRAYFSEIKKGVYGDTSGTTKKDDDSYELIMQHKERLLDEAESARFIFSHSALREGWDNPNVFQICTLREVGSVIERRQTLGRGLRLPVARTDAGYVRVADRGVATLTVIANESYKKFADALQKEYKTAGVEIGIVRRAEFSKLPWQDENGALTDEPFGYQRSLLVWEHLKANDFIDKNGAVTPKYRPDQLGFTLNLPVDIAWAEPLIIELVDRAQIGTYVKQKSKRKPRVLNKELYATPEFGEFWETISRRTTYRVTVDRNELIGKAIDSIKSAPKIEPLRIQITRAGITVRRGGAKGEELGTRSAELLGSYDLPDIISQLQEATSLTRHTIVDILIGSGRLAEFIGNPNDFIAMAKRILRAELAKIVVDGVQYEKIGGYVYELRELQKDGAEEKEHFLDQMYKLQHPERSDFDYVVYDSSVERQFAELLDSREDVKLFMKLPSKFKIDTPVGPYNPDWAIIKQEGGQDRIYMIRETKSTLIPELRRPAENAKIKAAAAHFKAIGVDDYAVSAPGAWAL